MKQGISSKIITGFSGFFCALFFLTRLNIPPVRAIMPEKITPIAGVGFFPLVGFLLGGLLTCFYLSFQPFLSSFLLALLAVGMMLWITGGLHEEALADTADGWASRKPTIEQKLRIMHEPTTGAYGVMALIWAILARFVLFEAFFHIDEGWVLFTAFGLSYACSRTLMVLLMYQLNPLQGSLLAKSFGKVERKHMVQAMGITAGLFLFFMSPLALSMLAGFLALSMLAGFLALSMLAGFLALSMLAGFVLCFLVAYWFLRHYFNGYSGDLLGACQQTSEIFLMLCAIITGYMVGT